MSKTNYIKPSADYRKAPGYRLAMLIAAFVIWVGVFIACLLVVGVS